MQPYITFSPPPPSNPKKYIPLLIIATVSWYIVKKF